MIISGAWAPGACAHSQVCTLNEHCYALSVWEMTNNAKAEGESVKIDTITDYLPGWTEDDFFTNEVWVGFDGGNHWVESGQIDEHEAGASGLYYFWAYQNHNGFEEGYPWSRIVRPSTNQWNEYRMVHEPSQGKDSWGIWINGTGVQVGTGMEEYRADSSGRRNGGLF